MLHDVADQRRVLHHFAMSPRLKSPPSVRTPARSGTPGAKYRYGESQPSAMRRLTDWADDELVEVILQPAPVETLRRGSQADDLGALVTAKAARPGRGNHVVRFVGNDQVRRVAFLEPPAQRVDRAQLDRRERIRRIARCDEPVGTPSRVSFSLVWSSSSLRCTANHDFRPRSLAPLSIVPERIVLPAPVGCWSRTRLTPARSLARTRSRSSF
jgi:hypothetical protein